MKSKLSCDIDEFKKIENMGNSQQERIMKLKDRIVSMIPFSYTFKEELYYKITNCFKTC